MVTLFPFMVCLMNILMMQSIGHKSSSIMDQNKKDRLPVVAGQFYPASPDDLKKTLSDLFDQAKERQKVSEIRGLVVPHAGYVFSGGVAASGYNQLAPDHAYKRIFIIASSHRTSFGKASVYNQGDYLTPLGRVEVDTEVANKLIENRGAFTFEPTAHSQEHSIEVQLPFLQYHMKKAFKLVPIVLGTHTMSTCREIAKELEPYFTRENLFIVSSDFSHYPDYEDAERVDKATAAAFCSNNVVEFMKSIQNNERQRIPGLATSMCAWPSALVLLYLTQANPAMKYQSIQYLNSGDIKPYGDKSSVVGYHAIVLTDTSGKADNQSEVDYLTKKEEQTLLKIARNTLESYVKNGKVPSGNDSDLTPLLKAKMGAFVTLKMDGRLRGCIGSFEPTAPLWKVVEQMTISSAVHDSRFLPVQSKELSKIEIEISVLTPLKKIDKASEIELGKHGIYMKKGNFSGTFLPQVADETGWNLEEFLGHCARDKAGIGWDGWKDADLYTYEAIVFGEKD